jgi:hypothetical protein
VPLGTGEMQARAEFVTEAEKPSSDGEMTVEALDRGERALATTQVPLVVQCGYAAPNGANHPRAVTWRARPWQVEVPSPSGVGGADRRRDGP